jgi:hypothetical protein
MSPSSSTGSSPGGRHKPHERQADRDPPVQLHPVEGIFRMRWRSTASRSCIFLWFSGPLVLRLEMRRLAIGVGQTRKDRDIRLDDLVIEAHADTLLSVDISVALALPSLTEWLSGWVR